MIEALAQNLGLGSLLDSLRSELGGYEIVDHWQRGEFHHDLVVRVNPQGKVPGAVLVVATNCNGGVKEILCFSRGAGARCALALSLPGQSRVRR